MVSYYVEPFVSTYNRNRWFYIDSYDGTISLRDNKWFVDFKIYLIFNGNLPLNMLQANIESPIFSLSNFTINEVSQVPPDFVYDKQMLHIYSLSTIIDMNDSGLLTNYVSEYNIYLPLTLSYDNNVVNNTNWRTTPTLDEFLNDLNNESIYADFTYSNYQQSLSLNGWYEAGEEYYINSKTGYSIYSIPLVFSLENYQNDKQNLPIINIANLTCDKQLRVFDIVVDFYYTIDECDTIHHYKYNDANYYYINDTLVVNFTDSTLFDLQKKEVIKSNYGALGFYVPTNAIGYYELSFKTKYKYNTKKYKLTNNFKYSGDSYNHTFVTSNETFIEDTKNFMEIT